MASATWSLDLSDGHHEVSASAHYLLGLTTIKLDGRTIYEGGSTGGSYTPLGGYTAGTEVDELRVTLPIPGHDVEVSRTPVTVLAVLTGYRLGLTVDGSPVAAEGGEPVETPASADESPGDGPPTLRAQDLQPGDTIEYQQDSMGFLKRRQALASGGTAVEWIPRGRLEVLSGQVLGVDESAVSVIGPPVPGIGSLVHQYPVGAIVSVRRTGHAELPASFERTFLGQQLADAVKRLTSEATAFARGGYEPGSQSWAPGKHRRFGGDQPGTLTVTFTRS